MGSIRKVDSGYKARVRKPGGGETTKTLRTQSQATAWIQKIEGDKVDGRFTDPRRGRLKVDDWISRWLSTKRNLRTSSASRVESIISVHISPAFGSRTLASLSNVEIRQWVANMRHANNPEKYLSPASVKKNLDVMHQIMEAAVSDQRISFNPCDNVPIAPPDHNEQRFLSKSEVDRLVASMTELQPRFRAFILLAAFGGLRFGELAGLRRGAVDTFHAKVRVTETLTDVNGVLAFGPVKTKNSKRTVVIPRSVAVELEAHLREYVADDPDALVFTGPEGAMLRRSSFRRYWWLPAVRNAGLSPLRGHDLRHTFVAVLIDAGCNPKQVSKWAGHSSVAFTLDRYGHLYDSVDEDMPERLDGLLEARSVASPRLAVVRSLET